MNCCPDGPAGHTRQEHHDASPCYDTACPLCPPLSWGWIVRAVLVCLAVGITAAALVLLPLAVVQLVL